MSNNTTKAMDLLNSIQAETEEQTEALLIASKAMEESHTAINKIVHFIRKMDNGPMTHNERLILQSLYKAASILSDASADIKYGPIKRNT